MIVSNGLDQCEVRFRRSEGLHEEDFPDNGLRMIHLDACHALLRRQLHARRGHPLLLLGKIWFRDATCEGKL